MEWRAVPLEVKMALWTYRFRGMRSDESLDDEN